MIDSMMSDQTPPGLRIHKNLEVINSSPLLKLKALQIFSEAEGKLITAILEHYDTVIPKLEKEIKGIYDKMAGITKDEKKLITLKLIAYKNELIREYRERSEKKGNKATEKRIEDSNPSTSESGPKNKFPWDQRPQRPPRKGRGRQQKNSLTI